MRGLDLLLPPTARVCTLRQRVCPYLLAALLVLLASTDMMMVCRWTNALLGWMKAGLDHKFDLLMRKRGRTGGQQRSQIQLMV
jgi:hypothetical protein